MIDIENDEQYLNCEKSIKYLLVIIVKIVS